jgi:SSS family solute:Na+ symporter
LQTFPVVGLGLFTRWFHRTGLIAGLLVGMAVGFVLLYLTPNANTHREHFGGSAYHFGDVSMYSGLIAVIVNLAVAAIVTLIARAAKIPDGADATQPADYYCDRN